MKSVTVIGGGIVGLAVARRLAANGIGVTVLEKEDRWAPHQTGHNSGVIHAGPYYRPGSLKAAMCTAGNASMRQFARTHDIPHDICGKLIVATSESELPGLQLLFDRGTANGTPCHLVTAAKAREVEPHINCVAALKVESTGIIDFSAVCRKLAELAADDGAELHLGLAALAIHTEPNGVVVETEQGRIRSDLLVNCAGLQCDTVARMAGVQPEIRIVPFRGEYYELVPTRRHLVNHLIYPVPDPELPFLGVHFTRMIDGSRHAGPNAVLALAREGYNWRTIVPKQLWESVSYPGFLRLARANIGTGAHEMARSVSKRLFARSLAKLIPAVRHTDIVRAGAGIRAQALYRDGRTADDFIIQRAPRQVHVLNAPSPAATASLEIARYVVDHAISEALQ